MANSFIQVPPDSTGKLVDVSSLDVGVNTVMRQRIVIGDNSATAQFAKVSLGALQIFGTMNISSMPAIPIGTVNNISRTTIVAGIVSFASPAIIDKISATTIVAGQVSIAAGTANMGFIDHISATTIVAGQVSLAAGTSNIGTINNISATVMAGLSFVTEKTTNSQVQVGDSANAAIRVNVVATVGGGGGGANPVSLAAGTANIGFINNISATVVTGLNYVLEKTSNSQVQVGDSLNAAIRVNVVAGGGTLVSLAAGTQNIGFINNISAPVVIAAGANKIGSLKFISQTVLIAGNVTFAGTQVSLAAGTANIGTINNISATVVAGVNFVLEKSTNSQVQVGDSANAAIRVNVVAGAAGGPTQISLAAGTANIGWIDHISAGVVLAAGTANIGILDSISATVGVKGQVSLAAGTANIGIINNISATVLVAGTVSLTGGQLSLAAGTANIGSINNISATVSVAITGWVDASGNTQAIVDSANVALRMNLIKSVALSLAAGTANIGFINNISAPVVLAAGANNIGSINNISATVLVGGVVSFGPGNSNIGIINNISATVLVAGVVSFGAGTANIGFINHISATVNVAGVINMNAVAGYTGTNNGPVNTIVSTSAAVVLVASAGATSSIYITALMGGCGATTQTVARIGTSATPFTIVQPMAANGGGFVLPLNPPWQVTAGESVKVSVKPNASNCWFTAQFYVK